LHIHKFILLKVTYSFLLLSLFAIFLLGCNPTKHVKPNELFLKKNTIKIDTRKIDKDELKNIVKQKSNRKILNTFRYHLGLYNFVNKKNTTNIKDVGEPPVIYDSLLTVRTLKQLKLYVDNKGYFDSKVSFNTKIRNNKIKVEYQIDAGDPYIIKKVDYILADDSLKKLAVNILFKTLVKRKQPFDADVFDKERERIKKAMRNEGYYYFNKDYVTFKIDSTIGNKELLVSLYINNQVVNDKENDTIYEKPHSKYYINDIDIFLSKDFKDKNLLEFDTVSFKNILLHYDGKLKYRPRMLNHGVSLNKNGLYLSDDQQNTYRYLSELNLFRNINISFDDIGNNRLDAKIFLTPSLTKSFSIEGIGTNSGGNLGIEGNLIYNNKNLFKGGEHLTIKLNGGLEAQQLINDNQEDINLFGLPFNTLEFGPEVNLEFPRFLLPVNLEKFSHKANPKTNLNFLLNFQTRPEYKRTLTQATFGYFWNESAFKRHTINPINISVINLNPTPDFQDRIDNEDNPFILSSFQDHFINSTTYSFVYNSQTVNKIKDFEFFKFNIEFAGNIQSAYNKITNKPFDNPETESYNIFNIRYAQFVKTDIDIRFYGQTRTTSFVKRINVGLGKPYGNLNALPFEKSYYGGGANGIRAWQARSLGPGSMPDSLSENSLSQIGELKIEGNLEYRFDVTKIVEGAAFMDVGNIWILAEDSTRPNAEFNPQRLWQDIAAGVGLGLRLDFNFFLIRFDLAVKLKDPSSNTPKKIDLIWNKPTLNLGIGYPF
jgi:outer membrane translocation and assembly module TamA